MDIRRSYGLLELIRGTYELLLVPLAWGAAITAVHEVGGADWISMPWLPTSSVAVAVAFYLGFKNNAAYDRTWEARKIWGAIVNTSRAWAWAVRDLVDDRLPAEGRPSMTIAERQAVHRELIFRHVAWLDALRHQLRQPKPWEHHGRRYQALRQRMRVPEHHEDLAVVLAKHVSAEELERVQADDDPAASLLARQSARLAELRRDGALDGFAHIALQGILGELAAQQGGAQRIKGFPFPRQFSTVNAIFAKIFCALLPFGLLEEFEALGERMVWAAIPFSALVSWVYLTADRIGDWSENPFEGLPTDVPISQIARQIEREAKQAIGEPVLPPRRLPRGSVQL